MAAPEEGLEPLRYQTLALKVRIHCEGCKKKVKKVLHSIEGVYKTDIDMQQQKVVVIGNVSTDTLVKKLLKTGKHAEAWPEPAPPPPADGAPGGSPGSGGGGGGKKKKKKSKSKNAGNSKPAEAAPAPADNGGGGGPVPPDNAGACEASDGEHDKPDGGGGGPPGAGDAHGGGHPVAMTPHGAQTIPPAGNGSGGGKRKGKRGGGGGGGQGNANANGDGAAGAIVEVHPPDAATKPGDSNAGGPITVIEAGPYPPAYVMSYHAAHPSPALRSSAYYHPMVGAAYTTGGGGGGGDGYFYSTAPAPAPPGSYYMFSEENANACTVM